MLTTAVSFICTCMHPHTLQLAGVICDVVERNEASIAGGPPKTGSNSHFEADPDIYVRTHACAHGHDAHMHNI